MTRAHRRNASAKARSASRSRSQSARLPLQENRFRIRNAKLSDAPELASLMCELGYETTSDQMRARLKSILPYALYSTFVARIGKELCGMIGTLTHMSHEHNDLSGKIVALVVSKKQRRSGVGRTLVAAAEKDFATRNVTRVTLRGTRLLSNGFPLRQKPCACVGGTTCKIFSSGRGRGIVLRREQRSAACPAEWRPVDQSNPRCSICRARI